MARRRLEPDTPVLVRLKADPTRETPRASRGCSTRANHLRALRFAGFAGTAQTRSAKRVAVRRHLRSPSLFSSLFSQRRPLVCQLVGEQRSRTNFRRLMSSGGRRLAVGCAVIRFRRKRSRTAFRFSSRNASIQTLAPLRAVVTPPLLRRRRTSGRLRRPRSGSPAAPGRHQARPRRGRRLRPWGRGRRRSRRPPREETVARGGPSARTRGCPRVSRAPARPREASGFSSRRRRRRRRRGPAKDP